MTEDSEIKIFAVKTTAKQERSVVDGIYRTVLHDPSFKVLSVVSPDELKGYVLIEAAEPFARIAELIESVPSARTVVPGETKLEEIAHYLEPKPAVAGIDEGTIVELIAGPFKGEKAVVKRVDSNKEEITVELYESMVPIPITVRGDNVRVIDRGEP